MRVALRPKCDAVERREPGAAELRYDLAVGTHRYVAQGVRGGAYRELANGGGAVARREDKRGGLPASRSTEQLGHSFEVNDAGAVLPEPDVLIAAAVVAPAPAIAAGAELGGHAALACGSWRGCERSCRLTGEVCRSGVLPRRTVDSWATWGARGSDWPRYASYGDDLIHAQPPLGLLALAVAGETKCPANLLCAEGVAGGSLPERARAKPANARVAAPIMMRLVVLRIVG